MNKQPDAYDNLEENPESKDKSPPIKLGFSFGCGDIFFSVLLLPIAILLAPFLCMTRPRKMRQTFEGGRQLPFKCPSFFLGDGWGLLVHVMRNELNLFFEKKAHVLGPNFVVWVGHIPLVVCCDPTTTQAVLSDCNNKEKSATNPFINLAGMQLFSVEGDTPDWDRLHTAFVSGVDNKTLLASESFNSIIQSNCERLCESWKKTLLDRDSGGGLQEVHEGVFKCCQSLLLELITGSVPDAAFQELAISLFMKGIYETSSKAFKKEQVILKEMVKAMLAPVKADPSTLGGLWKMSEMTEDEVANLTMFFAFGHAQLSCTVVWALHSLANHPKEQRLLLAEIQQARISTLADADKLPYLEACIRESSRLYPAVPFCLPRRLKKDHAMFGSDIVLKSGALIFGLPFVGLRWFSGATLPSSYRPERWLDGNSFDPTFDRKVSSFQFGGGARVCPAADLSLQITKLMVVRVVSDFQLEDYLSWDRKEKFAQFLMPSRSGAIKKFGDIHMRLFLKPFDPKFQLLLKDAQLKHKPKKTKSPVAKLLRLNPGWLGGEDKVEAESRLDPEDYLSATGEVIGVIIIISWIITFFFNPEVLANNPLKDRFGYNNVCVGWDTYPAIVPAAFLFNINVYLVIRYCDTDLIRAGLSDLKPNMLRFVRFSNVFFAFSTMGSNLIFMIAPHVDANAHTSLFLQLIFGRWLVVTSNFLESGSVMMGSWIYYYIYSAVSLLAVIFGILDLAFWGGIPGEPFIPWYICIVVDKGWFICLFLQSKFLPAGPNIRILKTLEHEEVNAAMQSDNSESERLLLTHRYKEKDRFKPNALPGLPFSSADPFSSVDISPALLASPPVDMLTSKKTKKDKKCQIM